MILLWTPEPWPPVRGPAVGAGGGWPAARGQTARLSSAGGPALRRVTPARGPRVPLPRGVPACHPPDAVPCAGLVPVAPLPPGVPGRGEVTGRAGAACVKCRGAVGRGPRGPLSVSGPPSQPWPRTAWFSPFLSSWAEVFQCRRRSLFCGAKPCSRGSGARWGLLGVLRWVRVGCARPVCPPCPCPTPRPLVPAGGLPSLFAVT